jgi:hypothetical protein
MAIDTKMKTILGENNPVWKLSLCHEPAYYIYLQFNNTFEFITVHNQINNSSSD